MVGALPWESAATNLELAALRIDVMSQNDAPDYSKRRLSLALNDISGSNVGEIRSKLHWSYISDTFHGPHFLSGPCQRSYPRGSENGFNRYQAPHTCSWRNERMRSMFSTRWNLFDVPVGMTRDAPQRATQSWVRIRPSFSSVMKFLGERICSCWERVQVQGRVRGIKQLSLHRGSWGN